MNRKGSKSAAALCLARTSGLFGQTGLSGKASAASGEMHVGVGTGDNTNPIAEISTGVSRAFTVSD